MSLYESPTKGPCKAHITHTHLIFQNVYDRFCLLQPEKNASIRRYLHAVRTVGIHYQPRPKTTTALVLGSSLIATVASYACTVHCFNVCSAFYRIISLGTTYHGLHHAFEIYVHANLPLRKNKPKYRNSKKSLEFQGTTRCLYCSPRSVLIRPSHLVVLDVDELVDRHSDDLHRLLHHLLRHVGALSKRVCVHITTRTWSNGDRLRDGALHAKALAVWTSTTLYTTCAEKGSHSTFNYFPKGLRVQL